MKNKFETTIGSQQGVNKTEQKIIKSSSELDNIFRQSQEIVDKASAEIDANLQEAQKLQEKLGEEVEPIVDQLQDLKSEVAEEGAAFKTRMERLNSPYVLSPELAKILEVARILEKPLLLEGEPGTGKTSLAYALAGHEDMPIIHVQCKSTTSAQELLYTFDVVKRLQDAQLGKDVSDLSQYVHLGPLGRAFASQKQVILVIDEIDKAKRDFSNDLLHELDQMSFFITETGEEIAAKYRPIVIITSNHEKDLPEPVLRRCVYSYIEFPNPEQMTEIVKAHIPDVEEKLLQSAIQKFYEIRQVDGLKKKPSTSEMLDWIRVLKAFGVNEVNDDIPCPETLLKYKEDLELIVGSKQKNYEESQEIEMPQLLTAVINGGKVVRLKTKSEYIDYEPDSSIYTLLANEGYKFITPNNYKSRSFDIKSKGVCRVDDLTFALYDLKNSNKDGLYLYNLLKKNNLIESEFMVTDKPLKFVEVEESNELYTKGKDEQNRIIYRTKDGKFIYEKKVVPEEING